ncbi:MAG: hypothetical protein IT435_12060 [Phycisphaerales bacterium]|nr:hypothetical protein [Phycisphaerales bacterium]
MSQMTPPIEPEPFPAELPKWPKVVGIISIVWASLGTCCGVLGLGLGVVGRSMIPPEKSDQFPPHFVSPPVVILGVVGLSFGLILLAAGIMTVSRKPIGRILHIVYSILSILIFPVSMYFNFQMQAEMEQWVQQNPNTDFAKQQAQMGSGGQLGQIIGMVIGTVMGLAYPVFCLIWFGLVKRKPGSMGVVPVDDVI